MLGEVLGFNHKCPAFFERIRHHGFERLRVADERPVIQMEKEKLILSFVAAQLKLNVAVGFI
ncbi:MAG: hypothetical protein IIW31_09420, partial [Clostridia bacterium]|nr:hypothetical protein [Clostridia bacterium]